MSSNRLEALKTLVAQDPANSFTRYGLAMEYVNSGDPESAVAEFEELLRRDPEYRAGYFHLGQTLEKLGRIKDAKEFYQQGIAASTRAGDSHTRSELEGVLEMLED